VAAKLSFEKGGDFILETRREVELYLASRPIRVRARLQLYAKTVVAFTVWAASWTVLIVVRPGIALGLVALGALVVGALIGIPYVVGVEQQTLAAVIVIYAIVAVSFFYLGT